MVNNGGCDANANCFDTIGSRTCICKDGYDGSGLTCNGKPSFLSSWSVKTLVALQ